MLFPIPICKHIKTSNLLSITKSAVNSPTYAKSLLMRFIFVNKQLLSFCVLHKSTILLFLLKYNFFYLAQLIFCDTTNKLLNHNISLKSAGVS